MNVYIKQEIKNCEDELSGYVTLFNYRIMNYCVKAELVALLPVTVDFYGSQKNLEDVAKILKPNDYQFEIFPKQKDYLDDIAAGIFDVHPEFKEEVITEDDERHLLYTMPEVDKNRRDLLNETVKTFYNECKTHLEECRVKYDTLFTENLSEHPADLDEVKNAISDTYDNIKEQVEKIYQAKRKEIEEGYKRYLEKQEEKQAEEAQKFDFTKGMPLNFEE